MNSKKVLQRLVETYTSAIEQNHLPSVKARHFCYRYLLSVPDAKGKINFESIAKPYTLNEICKFPRNKLTFTFLSLYEFLRNGFYADYLNINRDRMSKELISSHVLNAINKKDLSTLTYKVICVVYYAYFQSYCDYREELKKQFLAMGKNDFGKNYHYGLTHFVICDSNFYQMAPRNSNWISGILHSEAPAILSTKKLDLIAEAQLTSMMLGDNLLPNKEFEELIQQYYDEKTGYFRQSAERDINSSEHTNSLIMMILAQIEYNWMGGM